MIASLIRFGIFAFVFTASLKLNAKPINPTGLHNKSFGSGQVMSQGVSISTDYKIQSDESPEVLSTVGKSVFKRYSITRAPYLTLIRTDEKGLAKATLNGRVDEFMGALDYVDLAGGTVVHCDIYEKSKTGCVGINQDICLKLANNPADKKAYFQNLRKMMDELSACSAVEKRARETIASGVEATRKQLSSIKQMLNIGRVPLDTESIFAFNPKETIARSALSQNAHSMLMGCMSFGDDFDLPDPKFAPEVGKPLKHGP